MNKHQHLLAIFTSIVLLSSCSQVEIPAQNSNDIIYNEYRFQIIDLFSVEQLSRKYVFVYSGTEDSYHLLIALPLDKFSFNDSGYYALHVNECPIENSHYPEQALFYNIQEVEDWKAVRIIDGVCVVEEASQLRFLF